MLFEVLVEIVAATRDQLIRAEQHYLDLTASDPLRMNILGVAGSSAGRIQTADTRRKIGIANSGRSPSEAARAKMRTAKLGRRLSPEHRAQIGSRSRGRPGPKHSAEMLAKWRKYSDEQVARLRALVADGMPTFTAAKLIGMARATARRILAGESYAC